MLMALPVSALAAAVLAAGAAAQRPPPAFATPIVERFDAPAQAIAAALAATDDAPPAVVAFGELHQTAATVGIPSALRRFTAQILPGLSARLSHLVIETWVTTGQCGEGERAVTADVARTTERPAQTETEIEVLARSAAAAGVAPRILSISCADYAAMQGGAGAGGAVDYDRTLRITARALANAIGRALAERRRARGRTSRPEAVAPDAGPSAAGGAGVGGAPERFVAVYGGALHNDARPDPELAAYSFAPAVLAATLGRYIEIDLVVPEYAESSAAARAQPWWRAYRRSRPPRAATAGAVTATTLVRLGPRSFVVMFPHEARAKPRAKAAAAGGVGRPRAPAPK